MALRFEGYEPFGNIKAAKFVDDEDPSFVHFEDDPAMATRLGAPPEMPDQRLALNAPDPFGLGLNEKTATDAPKPPMDFESDVRQQLGAPPKAPQVVDMGPADTALGDRPKPQVEEKPELQDFGGPRMPAFQTGRTIKLSDGGMQKVSEQTSTSGPAGLNWTDEAGNPVDMQQDQYERAVRSTQEKKRIADEAHKDAGQQVIDKERQDLADLQAGWAREDQEKQNYVDEQGREYYGVTKAEGTRKRLAYDLEEAKQGRIDPNRLDKQRGVGDTILAAIGLFADAFGSGKENFSKALERARDIDVQQQIQAKEKRIAKAQGDLDRFNEETPTDYERGLAMGLSPEGAKEFAKARYTATQQYFLNRPDWQAMLKANKQGLDEYNNQLDDQLTKSIDAINKDVQVSTQAASRFAPPVYATVGGSPKLSENSILDNGRDTGMEWLSNDLEIRRNYDKADKAEQLVDGALRSLSKYNESLRIPDDEARGELESDLGAAAAALSMAGGQGAVAGNDVSIPVQIGGDPSALIKHVNRIRGALRAAKKAQAAEKARILSDHAAPRNSVERKKSK